MKKILCACGCGTLIDAFDKRGRPRRYVQWHGTRNPPEETRKKMRDARLGTHMSDVSKRKVSEANKGRQRTEEVKKKMSELRTGRGNLFYGKHHTVSTKKKISEAAQGEAHNKWSKESREKLSKSLTGREFSALHKKHLSESQIVRGSRKEEKELRSARRKKQKFPKHHTKPEIIFEEICKKYNIHFQYVGDSSLWIGKKGSTQLNPDFIEANGNKVCIEIMGDYWHSPLLNQKVTKHATLDYRKQHYRRFKWLPVFIWGSDLKRDDAEQFVLALLEKEAGIHATKGVGVT